MGREGSEYGMMSHPLLLEGTEQQPQKEKQVRGVGAGFMFPSRLSQSYYLV